MRRFIGAVLAVMLLFFALNGAATAVTVTPADGKSVTAEQAGDAIRNIPGLLSQSNDQGPTLVYKHPEKGVGIGNGLRVTLPNYSDNTNGKLVGNGLVAFDGKNDSTNAVQALDNGGTRMYTVIKSEKAATRYAYGISMPEGGKLSLVSTGGAKITGANGEVVASIAPPWAKDANGKSLKTHYSVEGNKLVQYVEHQFKGVAYPVTADPWFAWSWNGVSVYFSRDETRAISMGVGAAAVYAARTPITAAAAFVMYETASWARDRGYCVAAWKGFWSPWAVSAWAYRC